MSKISRRTFIAGAAATAALAGAGSYRLSLPKAPRLKHPNMILFLADDMRYDAAGFLGNSLIETPFLDGMAQDSMVFNNMFVTTSICPVSRASIVSGRHISRQVGLFKAGISKSAMENTMPGLLRKAGYYTGFVGKWGLDGYQPKDDFDYWKGFRGHGKYFPGESNTHLTDIQTSQAIKFIQSAPEDKPFLLVIAYKSPHGPYTAQTRFLKHYDHIVFPRAKLDTDEARQTVPYAIRQSLNGREYHQIRRHSRYQKFMHNYAALITGIDDSIRMIMNVAGETGRASSTSVFFTSDNGFITGDHRLMGKWCMYESSIRVPLLIRPAPDFFPAPAVHSPAMALNIDIAPTMLAMAKVNDTSFMHGKNLMPLFDTPDASLREGFYYQHAAGNHKFNFLACEGYRGTEWKYSRYNTKKPLEVLYNLKEDPDELNDLARKDAYATQLEKMRSLTAEAKKLSRSKERA